MQWNAGAWFEGQLGATVWMLMAGVLTAVPAGMIVVQSGGSISAQSTYWIIALIFGGIMLMFHMRFGRHRNGPGA